MIEATLRSTGALINKPRISTLIIEDESEIVMRKKDEETGQVVLELSIGQLFDAYLKRATYKAGEREDDAFKFESWFSHKYIKGQPIETRLIDLEFRRI